MFQFSQKNGDPYPKVRGDPCTGTSSPDPQGGAGATAHDPHGGRGGGVEKAFSALLTHNWGEVLSFCLCQCLVCTSGRGATEREGYMPSVRLHRRAREPLCSCSSVFPHRWPCIVVAALEPMGPGLAGHDVPGGQEPRLVTFCFHFRTICRIIVFSFRTRNAKEVLWDIRLHNDRDFDPG
jgi:hypothetical protein